MNNNGSKGISILLVLLLILSQLSVFAPEASAGKPGDFNGGSGIAEDPWMIATPEQLDNVRNYLGSEHQDDYFRLENDIDLSGYPSPDGMGWLPIGGKADEEQFTGHFDGGNHTITGLSINRPDTEYVGLFAVTGEGAVLSNVGLESVSIIGGMFTGGLVGAAVGSVDHSYTTGSVQGGDFVGGLIGSHLDAAGLGASTPFVFTADSEGQYHFVKKLGVQLRQYKRDYLIPNDYAQLDPGLLQPLEGAYQIHITNEFNEISYLDRVSLLTFDHDPGYTPALSFLRQDEDDHEDTLIKLVSADPGSVVSVKDLSGHEYTEAVSTREGNEWTSAGSKETGYFNPIEIDLGDLSDAQQIRLLLEGVSDNNLLTESGLDDGRLDVGELKSMIQVPDENGEWVDAYPPEELRPPFSSRTLKFIDLTDKFAGDDYRVRVGFTFVKWNYVAIDTSAPPAVIKTVQSPTVADLHFRGFSATDKTTYPYWTFDYNQVSPTPDELYAYQSGSFTRYGDVSPLLDEQDNRSVVMHYGDELSLQFDYEPPAAEMECSYILSGAVWYKSAKEAFGRTVDPLPFAGMDSYPYAAPADFPEQAYAREWNTRTYASRGGPGHTITQSYSAATVEGTNNVGGLAGQLLNKDIVDSYATGNVSGSYNVGGLAGSSEGSASVTHSYASGSVTDGSNAGGLIGLNTGTVTASFYDTDTTGQTDTEKGQPKSTDDMKTMATFTDAGWDFSSGAPVWTIDEAAPVSYPYFPWQNNRGDSGTEPDAAAFAGGSGTQGDPWIITTPEQLDLVRNYLNGDGIGKYFRVGNDIDLMPYLSSGGAGYDKWGDEGWLPIGGNTGQFLGYFDGGGHTISGLAIDRPTTDFAGLFGFVGTTGILSHVRLQSVDVTGRNYVGGLAGEAIGPVDHSSTTGSVTGSMYTGGLVGSHLEPSGGGRATPFVFTSDSEGNYHFVKKLGLRLERYGTDYMQPNDYAQLDPELLQSRDGAYRLSINNEFNEIPYLDRVSLLTFDHEPGYMTALSLLQADQEENEDAFIKLVSTSPRPAVSVQDLSGHDYTEAMSSRENNEWTSVGDKTTGYYHPIEIDLGDLSDAEHIYLLLEGMVDNQLLAEDGMYDSQSDLGALKRMVQVPDENGDWVDAYSPEELLAPANLPSLRYLDLTDKFAGNDYRVKVGFSYAMWNYIAVDTSATPTAVKTVQSPTAADLHFRGFSASDKTSHPYWTYDYSQVSPIPDEQYAYQSGSFTRYGDVALLLQGQDDRSVVMRSGDELSLAFDYAQPESGLERSFVLSGAVWYKHAKEPDGSSVDPLPFAGMDSYPYADPADFPEQDYAREWNTRTFAVRTGPGHTISESYSAAQVTGTSYVGGLVGQLLNKNTIDSYATGHVSGNANVGGLAGSNEGSGRINSSYATGSVSGTANVGGLVGLNTGTVADSFYDMDTTGQSDTGKGEPKSTAQMKEKSTFPVVSWIFDGTPIWAIDPNDQTTNASRAAYPYFPWQTEDADQAMPLFTGDYPTAGNVGSNGLDLKVQTDEAATAWYVVVPVAADRPTAAQIKAGTDADGAEPVVVGNMSLTAQTVQTVSVAGLAEDTAYAIYVVSEDIAGNLQSDARVATVTARTAAAELSGIRLDPAGDHGFDPVAEGYLAPIPYAVTVNNTGTGETGALTVALTGEQAAAFALSKTSFDSIAAEGADSFSVVPKTGLSAGSYSATVTVSGDSITSRSFTVSLVVHDASLPTTANAGNNSINASPSSLVLGGSATLTATGDRQSVSGVVYGDEKYVPVSWSSTESGKSGTFTVSGSVYTSLYTPSAAGSYTITVTFGKLVWSADEGWVAVDAPASKTTSVTVGSGSGSPSGGGGEEGGEPPSTVANGDAVIVLVNGKSENAGTATRSTRNNQSMLTIHVDEEKLNDRLAAAGKGAVVTVPVGEGADVVVGEWNGRMIKNMENHDAVLEIKTDKATYTIPAQQINIGAISAQVGQSIALEEIAVRIEISVTPAEQAAIVDNAAAKGMLSIVVPPLDFTVTAVYGDTIVDVSKFTAYVERTVAIPDGVDPARITTGVVVDPDGTVRHVPTKVENIDGKYYAVINSLTNSPYAVVWHPLTFSDVATHWAKDAVNDMGSRMVIEGTGDGLFSPDRDITRAEFAAIIVRGLGLKLEGSATFSDVKATDWYNSAIQTAYTYGLIEGYSDGTFRPNDKLTREQAMTIIARAMKLTGLQDKLSAQSAEHTLQAFGDATAVAAWAQDGVADTVQAGIVSGRSADTLAPQGYMTRAEVAAMIQRLLKQSGLI